MTAHACQAKMILSIQGEGKGGARKRWVVNSKPFFDEEEPGRIHLFTIFFIFYDRK